MPPTQRVVQSRAFIYTSLVTAFLLGALLAGLQPQTTGAPISAESSSGSTGLLANAQTGQPLLKSISRITFGPRGLLLLADSRAASIVAIETGDVKPGETLANPIDDVDRKVAAALGSEDAKIVDVAVNPASGRIYLAVQRGGEPVLMTVAADGELALADLAKAHYAVVSLPGGTASKVSNITDVQFSEEGVLAAGQSNEEFSSKIFSLSLPLTHGASASNYSAETYHVSHRRWETRAPIRSFVPYQEDDQMYVVGSFSCTPIAKFPLDNLTSGAKVQGISVVELGSGNQPLDMFTYQRDGKQWLVTNTYRFHFQKNTFGPSKWWGVRLDMKHLASDDKVNEDAVRRDTKVDKDPQGIEVVDVLSGAVQVAKVNDQQAVVLRNVNDEDRYRLELVTLP
ncbi:MAG: hypothetical protein RIC55_13015 [Pirellulaceae bacterium]